MRCWVVAERSFEIAIRPEEFDFVRTVTSGQTFRWIESAPHVWQGVDGTNFYRVEMATPSTLCVESNTTKEDFESLFRLDVSMGEVTSAVHAASGVQFGASCRGLRQIRASDPEEVFFCFLCTPNNNLSRIQSMVRKLAEFGEALPGEPDFKRFPSAQRIAQIEEQVLRSLGFGYRAKSIPKAAKALLERGPSWLEQLKGASYTEAFNEMLTIPGIGPKLADCILLYGLHFDEAVPVDTHLWQAARRHILTGRDWASLTERRYREIGDEFRSKFGRWAGWAQLLFYYDNMKLGQSSESYG